MRASHREVFGKKPADYSNWAFTIAESEIDLRTARLLTLEGAWKATAGLDYRHEAYVAKVHTARVANRIADTMLQLHGGMGYAMELPLERWYRELRVIRIYEGSDEVNLASIARNPFRSQFRRLSALRLIRPGWKQKSCLLSSNLSGVR